jgi:hypothetical protein
VVGSAELLLSSSSSLRASASMVKLVRNQNTSILMNKMSSTISLLRISILQFYLGCIKPMDDTVVLSSEIV